jgi:hypothetical protein
MNRVINLSPWNKISISIKVQHHTLIDMATIIIYNDDDYFYIEDDIEKIMDVSYMPHYIKEDWINYNKKELTNDIIDNHIKVYTDKYESQYPPNEKVEKTLIKLKSIKRHLTIKNII